MNVNVPKQDVYRHVFTVVTHSNYTNIGINMSPDSLLRDFLNTESREAQYTVSQDLTEERGLVKRIFITACEYEDKVYFYVNLETEKNNRNDLSVYATDKLWQALSEVAVLEHLFKVKAEPLKPNRLISSSMINNAIDIVGGYCGSEFQKIKT